MLRGMLALWLGLAAILAWGAVQWSIGDGQARPGEIGYIDVRLRHDGEVFGTVAGGGCGDRGLPDPGSPESGCTTVRSRWRAASSR